MTKRQQAMELFHQGYNCAQSVFGAFAEELGLPLETAMKLASSFGGGIGRLREVCGAVSGMAMVAGLKVGYHDPLATDEKANHYDLVQSLAKEFETHNESIICRDLLGLTVQREEPTPEARTEEYYQKRPCEELVGDAADIVARRLFGEV